MRRFLPLIILLIIIVIFLFGTFKKNTRVIPTPLIGQEVPLMELETVFFEEFENKDLVDILKSNKIKIINFWASWCLPCEVEHPILMGLSKKSDFVIIGINYKDTEEGSARFLNDKGNPYDLIIIDDKGKMGIEMGLTGVPETFVVNDQGKIIALDKSSGRTDKFAPAAQEGFKGNEIAFRELTWTANNLPSFKSYRIKLLLTSNNQTYPPRISELRVITLA